MQWIIWPLLSSVVFAAGGDVKKLMSDCYDGNLAKACLQLSEKLSKGNSATDHERAKLAKHRACTLGEGTACPQSASINAKDGASSTEIMTVKRSKVEAEIINLPELLQAARLEPRNPGFEFVQIEPKSAYEYLGFKLGDILLEINGHVLENANQAMELFVLLRSESDFKIKLKRAGKVIERKYEIKE